MKVIFEFVFENKPLKSLTSDMFSVYAKIAEEYNITQQECNFHSMKYTSDKTHEELKKKDKYDAHDKIWICSLLTEYKEIYKTIKLCRCRR